MTESHGAEEDRVVSRRVDNPTEASPQDERAYRAADPVPDADPAGASDDAPDDTGAPTRSE
jgi:hypothetical protein